MLCPHRVPPSVCGDTVGSLWGHGGLPLGTRMWQGPWRGMVGSLLGMGHVVSLWGACQRVWGHGGAPLGMGTCQYSCGD